MMRFSLFVVMTALAVSPASATPGGPFTAIGNGESFTYRVAWGIFPTAGEIVISGRDDVENGIPILRVATTTESKGLARAFFDYENQGEILIEKATGRILLAREKGGDGKNASDSATTFDYAKGTATHVNQARPSRNRTFELPAGDVIDLISCLIQTRTWEVKPGDKRNAVVYFVRDIYPVTLTAEAYEKLTTPLGTFKTLRLVPRMEQNPKGVFKRGGDVKVWVAQEGGRLPVRMKLRLNFGAATLTLLKYTPPTSEKPEVK
ncbi:MAG: hypothetical protein A3G75_06640 [Verrucomicrobia bacterium RIFCSPLOWO2_12_FULL_64_8]|nr:MAG: hypothetical protein A3G75_06640 [Verrucomicrobia bacterium RIFCSPLOWO2_12_FULL_64_8]